MDKEILIGSIITETLGSIPNDLECNLKQLVISYNVGTLQKYVSLRTANILRKSILKSIKQQRLEISRGWEKEIHCFEKTANSQVISFRLLMLWVVSVLLTVVSLCCSYMHTFPLTYDNLILSDL